MYAIPLKVHYTFKEFNWKNGFGHTETGKGNTIVILKKKDYISRLKQILGDSSKYERLHVEEGNTLNHMIQME